jgi:hypothetical protein
MADVSRLVRFVQGKARGLDLTSSTLVLENVKLNFGTGFTATFTNTTALTANRNIDMPNADVNLGDIALNTADRHSAVTLNADDATQQTLNLSGQEIQVNLASASNDGAMSLEDKSKLDGIEANAKDDQDASEVPYTPAVLTDWDGDVDPGNVDGALDQLAERVDDNEISISNNASSISTNATDISNLETAVGNSNATNMGIYSGSIISDNQSAKQNIQELETYAENTRSLVQNFEFQNSAIDYIVDNTLVPPTEVSGDRYVLSDDGGAPNAAWDGASAGDIVEFDGTSWVALSPTLGMVISIDDENSSLRQWGGSSWDQKFFESTTASTGLTKVGFDIRLADASLSSGIQVSSGAISIGLDTDPGLEFNANALRVKIKASSGLVRDVDGLSVNLGDFSTSDLSEGTNLYFTDARARTAAVDDTAYAGSWDGVTDQAPSKNAVYDKIESLDGADIGFVPGVLTDWNGDADPGQVDDALDQLASRAKALEDQGGNESVIEDMVIGESVSYTSDRLLCVRMAKGGETAGRVYLADLDATSADNFHVIGIIAQTAAITAADTISVYKAGKFAAGFAHGFTIGEEHFLGASGVVVEGGASGASAPSTANHAIQGVFIARTTTDIEVRIQHYGVN